MMNSMIKENGVTFKELEKYLCVRSAKSEESLQGVPGLYDRMLMRQRQKKYRIKGPRQTTMQNRVWGSNLSEGCL